MAMRAPLLVLAASLVAVGVTASTSDVTLLLDARKTLQLNSDPWVLMLGGQLTALSNLAASGGAEVGGNVLDTYLMWSSPSEMNYSLSVGSSNWDIMLPPGLDIPTHGRVPDSESPFQLVHNCIRDGKVNVVLNLTFLDAQTLEYTDPLEIEYIKVCDSSVDRNFPAFCSGSFETVDPAYGGEIKVGSFYIDGNLIPGESDLSVPHAEALASKIIAGNFDVVGIQDVWVSDIRKTISATLAENGFSYGIDSIGPDGGGTSSGTIFFSKLPIRSCGYETFEDVRGRDEQKAKGIFNAVVDAGAGHSLHVIMVYAQYGVNRFTTTRKRQFRQLRDRVEELTALYKVTTEENSAVQHFGGSNLNNMGLIVMGPMFTDELTYTNGVVSGGTSEHYSTMLEELGDPRDLIKEVSPTVPGYTTVPQQFVCPFAADLPLVECQEGQHVDYPGGRVDYMLSWDKVGDEEYHRLQVQAASVESFQDASYNFVAVPLPDGNGNVTDFLSTHMLLSVTVKHEVETTSGVVSPAPSAALVILLLTWCALLMQ